MVVFDTDLVIGLSRGDPDAQKAYRRHTRPLVSAFTWYELMVGCCNVRDTRAHWQGIIECMAEAGIVHMDDTIASIAARTTVALAKKGKCTGMVDAFIAASCIANGELLVTRNVKHFKNIPSLRIETW